MTHDAGVVQCRWSVRWCSTRRPTGPTPCSKLAKMTLQRRAWQTTLFATYAPLDTCRQFSGLRQAHRRQSHGHTHQPNRHRLPLVVLTPETAVCNQPPSPTKALTRCRHNQEKQAWHQQAEQDSTLRKIRIKIHHTRHIWSTQECYLLSGVNLWKEFFEHV